MCLYTVCLRQRRFLLIIKWDCLIKRTYLIKRFFLFSYRFAEDHRFLEGDGAKKLQKTSLFYKFYKNLISKLIRTIPILFLKLFVHLNNL